MWQQIAANQELIANNNAVMGVVLSIFSPISFVQACYSMQFDTTAFFQAPEPSSSQGHTPWRWPSWTLSQFAQFWLTCSMITALMLCVYVHLGLISVGNPAPVARAAVAKLGDLCVALGRLAVRLLRLVQRVTRRPPVDARDGRPRPGAGDAGGGGGAPDAEEETTYFINASGRSK